MKDDVVTWDFLIPTTTPERPVVFVAESNQWETDLRETVRSLPQGSWIILQGRRALAAPIIEALAGHHPRRTPAQPLRRLLSVLASEEITVHATYGVWPNLDHPRFAYTMTSTAAAKWIQRSGALGGGGNRLWARRLARSTLFTPLTHLLTPGYVLVARKPER